MSYGDHFKDPDVEDFIKNMSYPSWPYCSDITDMLIKGSMPGDDLKEVSQRYCLRCKYRILVALGDDDCTKRDWIRMPQARET